MQHTAKDFYTIYRRVIIRRLSILDRVELDILAGLTGPTLFYPAEEAYHKFWDWYIENIK